jgi:hypothetical protein
MVIDGRRFDDPAWLVLRLSAHLIAIKRASDGNVKAAGIAEARDRARD